MEQFNSKKAEGTFGSLQFSLEHLMNEQRETVAQGEATPVGKTQRRFQDGSLGKPRQRNVGP